MRKLITLITVAALTVILSDSFAGAASLDDAREAYQSGHYSTALEILRPLAQQGNAIAQLNLGRMYLRGDGVPQNYAEAFQWFNRSAKALVNPGGICWAIAIPIGNCDWKAETTACSAGGPPVEAAITTC